MTQAKWANFEQRVREIASHLWGLPCEPKRIGGVNIDGVSVLDKEIYHLVEMTEERNLGKVREDIVKLQTAKNAAFANGVLARCFCVINGAPTQAMKEAGEAVNIRVLSIDEFTRLFFDFESYRVPRASAPFGSSINPITGAADDTEYVPVRYLVEGRKSSASSADIAEMLRDGRNVVLLGEYGSGKSRCIREIFRLLSSSASENFCYPVAIDLRKSWGLHSSGELIRRHFEDLALDNLAQNAVKAFRVGSLALLLDGFDEVGTQLWSNDSSRLKLLRAKALEGVRDVVRNNKNGTLVAGREHYFPSDEEMLSALGLSRDETVIIRSKNEFSDTELLEYFQHRNLDVDVPDWLPRRPLICQTIGDLAKDEFANIFGESGDEIEFWNHFIRILCVRDANINLSYDPDTIFKIFTNLARLTRSKPANVGPISLSELQSAFEAATGAAPVEDASVMLQRLPGLGRVGTESNDRQFVDIYILDGLRGKDVAACCNLEDADLAPVLATSWANALDDLGQRVLAAEKLVTQKAKMNVAAKAAQSKNKTFACDLISSLMRKGDGTADFGGLTVSNGNFLYVPLHERKISNLKIENSYLGELELPVLGCASVEVLDCIAHRVSGISSLSALPSWIQKLQADEVDSVASVSRIRRIGLTPAQEILITIIRKTFFQKGAGRKEEALLRGLGKVGAKSLSNKILNILIREKLLTSFKGDEGNVYAPVRQHAPRMQAILDELGNSKDALWTEVSAL